MNKTALATALALSLGTASIAAEAGTAGITGVWTGTYSFSMSSPGGGAVGAPTAPQAWTFDFDAGTVSIANTTTFYASVWTAKNVTFNDNGDGTYGNTATGAGTVWTGTQNMLFDWSNSVDIPVAHQWDITDNGDGTADATSIFARILTPTPSFPGFQPQFSGTLNQVPVPAAAWLFGSGLLGLVGIARRRRNS